jgi:frataxin
LLVSRRSQKKTIGKKIPQGFFKTKKFLSLTTSSQIRLIKPFSFSFSEYQIKIPILSEEEFTNTSLKFLDNLSEAIDNINIDNLDVNFSDGILKLNFNKNKEYVINIQRPNKQIWFSSPISGPQRYEFDKSIKQWVNIRTGVSMIDLLNNEINNILKDSGTTSATSKQINIKIV